MQEYCNGGSLRHLLQKGYFQGGWLPHRWNTIFGILRGIANGMDHMHSKRICHGDLNPSNILFKVIFYARLLVSSQYPGTCEPFCSFVYAASGFRDLSMLLH